ncbi:MAG: RluA family pseudouridine synthase, partial [Bacilli bacterium]|nr:RluA family pseudouridine synthase [Bacilli bacterium]
MEKLVVEEENIRLDQYLSNSLDISRSKIQKLLKQDKILVNGKKEKSSYLVQINDLIEINSELDFSIKIEAKKIPLDIVYEDDYLMIINKKSGMVVHPAPGHYTDTLVNALLYHFNIKETTNIRVGIVHRLDKDTSGLMMVAKTDEMLEKLSNMIKEKEVKRHYLALVDGVISHDSGTIDAPIGRDINTREKMMVTDINSKEAVTHFKVLERYKE